MKTLIKGILLYTTIILTIVIFCSIDSLLNTNIIPILIGIDLILLFLTTKIIKHEELPTLLLSKWFSEKGL